MVTISVIPYSKEHYPALTKLEHAVQIVPEDVERIPFLKKQRDHSVASVGADDISAIIDMSDQIGMNAEMFRMLNLLLHKTIDIKQYSFATVNQFTFALNFLGMVGKQEFIYFVELMITEYSPTEIFSLQAMRIKGIFRSFMACYEFSKINEIMTFCPYAKGHLDCQVLGVWIFLNHDDNERSWEHNIHILLSLKDIGAVTILQTLQHIMASTIATEKLFCTPPYVIREFEMTMGDLCKLIHNKTIIDNVYKNFLLLMAVIRDDINLIRLVIEKIRPTPNDIMIGRISPMASKTTINYLLSKEYITEWHKMAFMLHSNACNLKEVINDVNTDTLKDILDYHLMNNNVDCVIMLVDHITTINESDDIKFNAYVRSCYIASPKMSYEIGRKYEEDFMRAVLPALGLTWYEYLYQSSLSCKDELMMKRFEDLKYTPDYPPMNVSHHCS
jgi:hypothetical protein